MVDPPSLPRKSSRTGICSENLTGAPSPFSNHWVSIHYIYIIWKLFASAWSLGQHLAQVWVFWQFLTWKNSPMAMKGERPPYA